MHHGHGAWGGHCCSGHGHGGGYCGCGCMGRSHHGHHRCCGGHEHPGEACCSEPRFQRQFKSLAEEIEELEAYRQGLANELEGVERKLKQLKKD